VLFVTLMATPPGPGHGPRRCAYRDVSGRRACDQYLVRSAPAEHQQRPALDPNRP
jgi:hypothetical protein